MNYSDDQKRANTALQIPYSSYSTLMYIHQVENKIEDAKD